MVALQAPPSLGFSRQEHWSGLPFPSPIQESEKWKWSHSVMSNSSRPHGLQPTRLLRPWDFLGKSTGVGCHRLPQSVWQLHKKRHTDQWNRTEGPEINPHMYGQLIYDKRAKNIQWGKNSLFSKWCWENWTTHQKNETRPLYTPHIKINSKCIKDVNVRTEAINSRRKHM